MNPMIVSCETLRCELEATMNRCGCDYPVVWLEAGLHNVSKKLNTAMQEKLDSISGFDTVLIAMSFCGNSVLGLQSRDFQLVIPKCDDCISLLLGTNRRPMDTLFFTEGWLKGGHHLGQEYDECLEKYGEKRGKRIFQVMLKNYRHIAMVDTGCYDTAAAEPQIRAIGKKLGLAFTVLPGSPAYLYELLRGNWEPDRFQILPPNSTLKGDYHDI